AFGNAENGFLFAPRVGGCREAAPLDPGAAGPPAFGAGEGPLASPWLQPGPLQELPAGRQRGFVSCAVLAMYGLSRTLVADRRTGFELPYELSPRRHRLSRILAAALLIYACAVAVFGGIRVYRERLGRFEGLRRQRLAAEERIDRLSKRLDGDEGRVMQELRTEFSELSRPRPSMTAALVEITRRVGLGGWCTAFRWRDGSISIQLREQQELEELERLLETSPLLGDVRQEYKKVQGGVIDRKVEMNARYDLENEQSEPPPPRERPPEEADEEIPLDDLLPLDEAGAPDPEDAPPASLQVAPGARRRPLDMRVQGLTPPPPPPSMMPPGEER
ncbi:MAG: hypothetical protein JXR77_19260, partial [Lentisphaeria bacterium]|nr:hypothetical protein [Lentisphaeria bacterium]